MSRDPWVNMDVEQPAAIAHGRALFRPAQRGTVPHEIPYGGTPLQSGADSANNVKIWRNMQRKWQASAPRKAGPRYEEGPRGCRQVRCRSDRWWRPICPRSDAVEVVEQHVVALDVVALLASAATRQRWLFASAGVRAPVHRRRHVRARLE